MSVKFKDYYDVLGVPRTASEDDIKQAYRRLVRRHHPDLHPEKDKPAATERLKQINEAYSVLGDKDNRPKYDRFGERWKEGQDFEPPPPSDGQPPRGFRPQGAEAFSDFFHTFFGGARGARQASPWEAPGSALDVEAEAELTLAEAAHGAEKAFSLEVTGACLDCGGTGREGRSFCGVCGGAGEVRRRRQVHVRLPPNLREGSRVRIKGKGNESGGRVGDLYVRVWLAADPRWRVEGSDLEATARVMPWEAALGALIDVPTLEGPTRVRLPSATTAGRLLLLRGKGLGKPGGGRGDLRIRVVIDMPSRLSERARALFQELEKEAHEPLRSS